MLTLVNKFVRESLIRSACRIRLHVIWAFLLLLFFLVTTLFIILILTLFVICCDLFYIIFLIPVALVMDECAMRQSMLGLAFRNL